MVLFACAIFLSSFLLFLIQPIFAKLILPWFGGSSAVWIMCLVFFQVALLIGYVYAHYVSARLRPATQVWLHIGLLAIALAFLPVIPGPSWKPASGEDPTWRILGLLTVVLGLPYILLSSTGPLLQSWYVRRWPESQPYRLFALSNVAALLALCAYPIWIEPRMATRAQDIDWSIGFAAFAVLAGWSACGEPLATPVLPALRPDTAHRAIWIALAAGGSMLLLSTTNQLTQNVAPVPLLWILPLAIYLLTFILCFESTRWYRRELFLRLLAVALASVGYAIYDIQESTSILVALPIFGVGLFLCCMYCHGELSRRKPQGAHLTSFYLMVALGGALGAVFVGLIAPLVFSGDLRASRLAAVGGGLALVSIGAEDGRSGCLWLAVTVAMALVLISEVRGYRKDAIVMTRNFYGGLRVVQSSRTGAEVRTLYHGTIEHGAEFMAPARRMAPTSYYGPLSGGGLALRYAVNGSEARWHHRIGRRHLERLRAAGRRVSVLRNQSPSDRAGELSVLLSSRQSGAGACNAGRRASVARTRACPGIRRAGRGCVLRRRHSGPPADQGSVRAVLQASEADGRAGDSRLESISGSRASGSEAGVVLRLSGGDGSQR